MKITSLRPRLLTLLLLALAAAAMLSSGALILRQTFLLRGMIGGLPEPIFGGGAVLGLNVSLEQYDDEALEANLDQIGELGVRYLKQSFYFSEKFDWSESDRLVDAAAAHGFVLVPLLDGDPSSQFAPPANPAEFALWAGQFADRYADELEYYIIWDEPNLTSHWGGQPVNAAEYAALLTAAARAVRRADPGAVLIAAPLAPTSETGPMNLADPLFLQQLYDAGAAESFDIAAGKPYGFYSGPDDRAVRQETLNFSRAILLRETMDRNGDGHKAIWAGNWGWNSLGESWQGEPSIWGQTSSEQQVERTVSALRRAQLEWPWMGVMFLEHWQPAAAQSNPRLGFAVSGRALESALKDFQSAIDIETALPGFHLAQPGAPSQSYAGNWRFSPEYGADISDSGDAVAFRFWGTDVGLRVRRADFRARLYVIVDDQPANALPRDENGSMLILTSADPSQDFISTEWVAKDLDPGPHTVEITASRGWDQWALNGFSAAYHPADVNTRWALVGLVMTALLSLGLAIDAGRRADWSATGNALASGIRRLSHLRQLILTAILAAVVSLAGWMTWGQQVAGMYRRLGDSGQLALTALMASIFYVTPTFFIFTVALLALLVLIYFRPAWGIALIAFTIPLYVRPKPIISYRFSPVEIFMLVTFIAFILARFKTHLDGVRQRIQSAENAGAQVALSGFLPHISTWKTIDFAVLTFTLIATISLFFTERLDVATNEWRVVILEPALFYLLLRGTSLSKREMWTVIDAFVLGGLLVAGYGLWQYGFDRDSLITAEGGLMRLRSFFGSPNNVGLYLGRIFPMLAAVALLGTPAHGRRRWIYGLLILPVLAAALLSFSKGALFLGIPGSAMFIFWRWQRAAGRRTWPWLIGFAAVGISGILAAQNVPQIAERLSLRGPTGVFRVNLWRAAVNMIADHPWFGVGLDNFLYAYRGRYILAAAWQEPDLSHPHNILLDFGSRLGLLGLAAGGWMIGSLAKTVAHQLRRSVEYWMPISVGVGGALVHMLLHGMVDHSFFLVDLAFAFYFMMGLAVWIRNQELGDSRPIPVTSQTH